ncbi:hypothetical protein [Streptomyces sp. NPDC060031]|uniref:hypothetical protein n=1 Tax=Streptomyces sp. NPDC060031 TaxID=3347043 RepID=UPI003678A5D0
MKLQAQRPPAVAAELNLQDRGDDLADARAANRELTTRSIRSGARGPAWSRLTEALGVPFPWRWPNVSAAA